MRDYVVIQGKGPTGEPRAVEVDSAGRVKVVGAGAVAGSSSTSVTPLLCTSPDVAPVAATHFVVSAAPCRLLGWRAFYPGTNSLFLQFHDASALVGVQNSTQRGHGYPIGPAPEDYKQSGGPLWWMRDWKVGLVVVLSTTSVGYGVTSDTFYLDWGLQ